MSSPAPASMQEIGIEPKRTMGDLLVVNRPVRALRSNSDNSTRLVTPLYRTETYGGRAFSSCAPRLWNQLPPALRSNMPIDVFKKQLKTFLFD